MASSFKSILAIILRRTSASVEIELLMGQNDALRLALSALPRKYTLVYCNGKSEVEIADLSDGRLNWRV